MFCSNLATAMWRPPAVEKCEKRAFPQEVPALRIVDDALWQEVKTRQEAIRDSDQVAKARATHARLSANAELSFRIDLVLRDRRSGKPLSVIDTKYKTSGQPSESDIQQVVAYAVELGVSRAYLVYPFSIDQPVRATVGDIRVSTLGIDLQSPLEQIWGTLIPLTC